jgi:hypothetical protein
MIDPRHKESLDEIAAWLLSTYGGRLVELRLTLLAHPDGSLLGVLPHAVRGLTGKRRGPLNLPERETWQTLSSRDIRYAAESAYQTLVPGTRFHHGPFDDAERLGVGRNIRPTDLDLALAAELVQRFGPLPRPPRAAQPAALFDEDEYNPVNDALQEVAEWLISRHGKSIDWISLTIQGYYSVEPWWGIIPTIGRGMAPDGSPETRETLPTRAVAAEAEALLARLVPGTIFEKISGCDVRHVASASARSNDLSSHKRLTLIRRHGQPAQWG